MYSDLIKSFESLSAEDDDDFKTHFIETRYLSRIAKDDSHIIYGTKGAGKTALRRALTEIRSADYFQTITVDLQSISFSVVYNRLNSLHETVKQEIQTISRAAWKNTLINYALLSFCDNNPQLDLSKSLKVALKDDGFLKPKGHSASGNGNERINNTIESIFRRINKFAYSKNSKLVGTTAEQDNIVNKFPINDEISRLLAQVVEIIERSGKKILVCIDGFDSIVKHEKASRQVIFAGLIDAIYYFRLNKFISSAFSFRAFLPQELTQEANSIIWDSDKHLNATHYISWNKEGFEQFVLKRLAPFSNKNHRKFADVWAAFMPVKLTNPVYNIEEDTFSYILRHTLYRPRQIINHIFSIMRAWDERNSGGRKIMGNFIPKIVAQNNYIMAEKVAEQLSNVYPRIIPFLKSWNNSPTLITVEKLRERIKKYFQSDSEDSYVDETFDELYIFGIFGILNSQEKGNDQKKLFREFYFSFVDDHINNSIHSTVEDEDVIAFSPMFREYCGLQKKNDFIITPISHSYF